MTDTAVLARRWRRVVIIAAAVAIGVTASAVWPSVRQHDSVSSVQADESPSSATSAPSSSVSAAASAAPPVALAAYPGMPPVIDPNNIYSEIGPGHFSGTHASDPARVYVPDGKSDRVTVIDPTTRTVIGTFATGRLPQHIVPSYDLSTLWVLDNEGSDVIPIDPATGTLGSPVPVEDPYNLYFTPDGASAIVVAEANERLDFRDPSSMQLTGSLPVPDCGGINHADYNA